MNSQEFLILNVVCVSLLLLWYWRTGRAVSKGPSQLNLKAQDSAPLIIPPESAPSQAERNKLEDSTEAALNNVLNFNANLKDENQNKKISEIKVKEAKSLNIIFNYNGHSWDAYEVLGVPAGSPLPAVTAAYQKALKQAEPDSFEFLECAYKSILDRF